VHPSAKLGAASDSPNRARPSRRERRPHSKSRATFGNDPGQEPLFSHSCILPRRISRPRRAARAFADQLVNAGPAGVRQDDHPIPASATRPSPTRRHWRTPRTTYEKSARGSQRSFQFFPKSFRVQTVGWPRRPAPAAHLRPESAARRWLVQERQRLGVEQVAKKYASVALRRLSASGRRREQAGLEQQVRRGQGGQPRAGIRLSGRARRSLRSHDEYKRMAAAGPARRAMTSSNRARTEGACGRGPRQAAGGANRKPPGPNRPGGRRTCFGSAFWTVLEPLKPRCFCSP
jgi:hypothetical protein